MALILALLAVIAALASAGTALAGGRRAVIAAAFTLLGAGGLLAVEVGHNRDIVETAFPRLPLTWLDTESGAGKIFLLRREDLA